MLFYVVEPADWVIKWVGQYITKYLNEQRILNAKVTTRHEGIHRQIVHFGSRNLFLPETWKSVDPTNRIIFTWYHGSEQFGDDENLLMIKALPQSSAKADLVHTACTLAKEDLVGWGVPAQKIVVVPLGVDTTIFRPVSDDEKVKIKLELGLPANKLIIGSFQKDGVGWGDGNEPKLFKGPDVFIEVLEILNGQFDNIFVLLTGPARGYVKRELGRIGVPFEHRYLTDYRQIPKYYNALDLYLVTSRIEGGPLAILEAMASGTGLVSTKVGMAPDVIKNGYNGLLAEIDDVATLSDQASRIIEDPKLKRKLMRSALQTVQDYSWDKVANLYFQNIYSRFLHT